MRPKRASRAITTRCRYLTDGLCAAIYTPTVPTLLTEVGFFDWEQPTQDWD
jgi:hypothetical protein